MALTVAIRVQPGSPRTAVGGIRGEALVVRVTARPVQGKATEAALRAVAEAFGVRRADVRLVSGAASRDKVVHIDGDPGRLASVLAALRQ
ncbi:MAG TPA: DUF167 domain-containing protein [Actinobacteria bacterium]|nr:DUF167 domain-containing protein [Actinomycetota bacterium]